MQQIIEYFGQKRGAKNKSTPHLSDIFVYYKKVKNYYVYFYSVTIVY